jgi:probable F420-dependent oxidoreductase
MDLTGVGIWSVPLRYGDAAAAADAAAELESLGYHALWVPDIGGDPLFDALENLLRATDHALVATGILNLWMHEPADVATSRAGLADKYDDRLMLGIGVSHAPIINATAPGRYARPLETTARFLDALDATDPPVPADRRMLAALGPKMVRLAAQRSAGAHSYLVPPEHTAIAREQLGTGPLLVPEQTVVLTSDREVGYPIARGFVAGYLQMPNYRNNVLRLGFTADDVENLSERLVDALVVTGDEEAIAARVREHLAAGADHVCVQVLTGDSGLALDQWRRLAPALPLG